MDAQFPEGERRVKGRSTQEQEINARGTTQQDVSRVSYSEVFEQQCPWYMAIGMTLDEYWNGPAELVKYYRKAHEYRAEFQNEQNWLLGMYVCHAVAYALNGKKSKYPEQPFALDTEIGRKRKEREQELNELKTIDYLNTWTEQANQKFYAKQRAELEKKAKEQTKVES